MGVRDPQLPEAIGDLGAEPTVFGDFCNSLNKIGLPHFEAYLSLNFYKNLFLFL